MTPDAAAGTIEERIEQLPRIAISHKQVTVPEVARRHGRFTLVLRLVDSIHRADRAVIAGLADGLVIATAGLVANVPTKTLAPLAVLLLCVLYVAGWYRYRSSVETQGLLWSVSSIATPTALVSLAAIASAPALGWARADVIGFGVGAVTALLALRILTWVVLVEARRRGFALRRTLIVGGSKDAQLLSRKLYTFPEAGLLPVAMLPCRNGHGYLRFVPDFPEGPQLAQAIAEGNIEHVVLAPAGSEKAIIECVKGSSGQDVSFSILPPLAELFLNPGHVAQVGGVPLISLGKVASRSATQPGKRLFDMIGASLLLVILSPLMALTALAIKLSDRGPVFYRQKRVGRHGGTFDVLKFRSMSDGAERIVLDLRERNASDGLLFKIVDDPRVTSIGKITRRFAIDELPQLWNVIRGEMSLVGPRPLAVEPEDFGVIDDQRHSVSPGITGYWQIAGGNGLTYEEMIKLDLAYIQNWSLWLDVRLIGRTIPALMHRRGPW